VTPPNAYDHAVISLSFLECGGTESAVMGGKLVASVAIYVAPERSFGAGGAR